MTKQQTLIPTSHRQKLPTGRSYPLGAEILSQRLYDVLNFENLKLSFIRDEVAGMSGHMIYEASLVRVAHHGDDSLHRFREVLHIRPPRFSSTIGVDDTWTSDWSITVISVPGRTRARVRSILEEYALPVIYDWINKPRPTHWFYLSRFLQVGIDEDVQEMCLTEIRKTRREWIKIVPLPNNA